jgi:hypothetical protein
VECGEAEGINSMLVKILLEHVKEPRAEDYW